MSERLLCGWGAPIIATCGCNGSGIKPSDVICTCDAGKRLRLRAQSTTAEQVVLCNGVLPDPDPTVYGPGPSIDNSTRYGS